MTADDAILVVHRRYRRALIAYAAALLGGDRAAGEDVVQEAMLRAWQHPAVIGGEASVRGWLITVVHNLAVDRIRARFARPAEVPEQHDGPVERDHADPVVTSLVVRAALRELSDEHRGALDLIYLRGHSMGEAAAALGVPAGTVKSRTFYGLRAMRHALAG